MNKISMTMLMDLTQNDTKKKIRPSAVKRLRDMRQTRRLPLAENVDYNTLWAQKYSADSDNEQSTGKEAQTLNFSDGGLSLLTSEALKPLEVVQLNLSLSRFGIAIPTIAEVIWADRRSVDGLYRIGLRYLL